MAELTPSQTVGPFFEVAMPRCAASAFGPGPGRIVIEGRVLDGDREPVPDALVETWQADAGGQVPAASAPNVGALPEGFARAVVDQRGAFAIETVVPGAVLGPDGRWQAPHLVVGVFARGLLARLVTRIYFADIGDHSSDPILLLVPAERRGTLMARSAGGNRYHFDIVLQGVGETVFFDV